MKDVVHKTINFLPPYCHPFFDRQLVWQHAGRKTESQGDWKETFQASIARYRFLEISLKHKKRKNKSLPNIWMVIVLEIINIWKYFRFIDRFFLIYLPGSSISSLLKKYKDGMRISMHVHHQHVVIYLLVYQLISITRGLERSGYFKKKGCFNLQMSIKIGVKEMFKNFLVYFTKSLSGFFWESISIPKPVEAMTSKV